MLHINYKRNAYMFPIFIFKPLAGLLVFHAVIVVTIPNLLSLLCSFDEKEACIQILEKMGLKGYQVIHILVLWELDINGTPPSYIWSIISHLLVLWS